MSYKIKNYRVVPSLPKELGYLKELTYNLYWTWDHNSRALFRRIDSDLWDKSNRNPAVLLGLIDQERLEELAKDEGYLAQLQRVKESVKDYMSRKSWFEKTLGKQTPFSIAYFSMEYGLTNGLPIYSGGLGILAGDHLKSASDLGLPLVGIGLAYQQGYFQQYLANDGWQQETYPENDFYNLPITPEKDADGNFVKISVDFPGRKLWAQIWKVQVGRVPLYLLDANVPENREEDRAITAQLYGGDNEMRIQQEILLGIGGVRALMALGIKPEVCHMNEGHAGFLSLERARILMEEKNINFHQAREATRGGNVFTTHTPVPAGIDEFDLDMVDNYLGAYYHSMGISKEFFYQLGGVETKDAKSKFNMAIFGVNMAGANNGVSKLHGVVARSMWNHLWKDLPEHEVAIGSVTNGIHVRTWISEDLAELFYRYLSPKWYRNPVDTELWENIDQIPDEELWRTHSRRRERLVAVARKRLYNQLYKAGASGSDLDVAWEVLNPQTLTIGFARRFASYKRAFLLFKDLERLKKIVNDADRPVQILIAGKAHPMDKIGKTIIRDIVNTIRQPEFRHKIVFLENYDMTIASYLVQGVDVWLNTPRRPREASGTSGMKAAANAALNLSILDGWWDEAYTNEIGWAIGRREIYDDPDEQDRVESEALYHLLETEVVPLYYKRSVNDLPRDWIAMMKENMKQVCPVFNTNRMVSEYFTNYYMPAAESWSRLSANNFEPAKELAEWRSKILNAWDSINIVSVESNADKEVKVGENITVKAKVSLGDLTSDDVCISIYYGVLDNQRNIDNGQSRCMESTGTDNDGNFDYEIKIPCPETGQHGFSVRILPMHENLTNPYDMRLVKWYQE